MHFPENQTHECSVASAILIHTFKSRILNMNAMDTTYQTEQHLQTNNTRHFLRTYFTFLSHFSQIVLTIWCQDHFSGCMKSVFLKFTHVS